MTALFFIALTLILEPLIERIYQHLLCYRPMCFKLTAGKAYHAFTAKERLSLFHHRRQTVFMTVGVFLLLIITGKEIFLDGNSLQMYWFLCSLTCILLPLCEMSYYRWSTGRYYKPGMTAKETSAYHDFCERYYRHSFSLNGEGRKRLRFYLLSIGIILLIGLTINSLLT